MTIVTTKKRNDIFKNNIGLIIGMVLGASGAWLTGTNLPNILLWVIIGGALGRALGRLIYFKALKNKKTDNAVIQLREEMLAFSKDSVKTADVSIHKEVINEVKHMAIPVKREELVIQTKMLGLKNNKGPIKTLRIPISEEKIDIIKQPKAINDVSVYKNRFLKHKIIKEKLKKETVHVTLTTFDRH